MFELCNFNNNLYIVFVCSYFPWCLQKPKRFLVVHKVRYSNLLYVVVDICIYKRFNIMVHFSHFIINIQIFLNFFKHFYICLVLLSFYDPDLCSDYISPGYHSFLTNMMLIMIHCTNFPIPLVNRFCTF